MKLDAPGAAAGGAHLTYCSNIHPGETWAEVRDNLRRYLPRVKQALASNRPFGVGLRLSAAAGDALADPASLAELQAILADNGLYVFTINGFPYGVFHRARVKEEVYLPDWQDEERLRYTDHLADLLAALLPDEPGLDGSVSTVPGAFKPVIRDASQVQRMADLMIRHVAHLVALRRDTGRTIALALEPEPCCYLETIAETVTFFRDYLFSAAAVDALAAQTGLDRAEAEPALRRHIGVCLDLCHAAVEFEDPDDCLAMLRNAGIGVPKMQLSAGLRFAQVGAGTVDLLRPFNDAVYLHQVVQRDGAGQLSRYVDLPDAFAALPNGQGAREWRVHFHVPIFLDDLGAFGTTQPFLAEMLARHRRQPISAHLEVETYTWDVLPERYRKEDVVAAIVRELTWVERQLAE